jgi:hypothetical protein
MGTVITVQVQGGRVFRDMATRFPGSMARALNRTAEKTRTLISKRIREVYKVKAEALKTDSRGKGVIFVGEKATASHLASVVRISSRHVSWGKYPGLKWRRAMRGAQIDYKGGKLHTIKGSFVPKMASGHRGVFRRTGKARLPIVELSGPSPAQMLRDPLVDKDVGKDVATELQKEIDQAVRDIVRGYGS